jgi:hypothetical protein
MADFSHVSAGQTGGLPYRSAGWLNDVSDTAAAFKNVGTPGVSGKAHSIDRNAAKIKNLTGADLVRGHCVQLGEFELDAKDPRKIWFEGNLYDEAIEMRVAIVTNAVKQNARVDSVLIGIAVAVVDVTDTDHRFAEPVDGEYILTSAANGSIEILDTVTETGEQECAVLLGAGGGGGATADSGLCKIVTLVTGKTEAGGTITYGVGEAVPVIQGTLGEATYDTSMATSEFLNPDADAESGLRFKIWNFCTAPIPVGKEVSYTAKGIGYTALGGKQMKFVDAEDCG